MTLPHHHPHGHPHDVAVPPSLLRLSAWQRLGGAAAISAVLWVAILWVIA